MSSRTVLLGLSHARSPWVAELSRWTTGGLVAAEFLNCLTLDELRVATLTRNVGAVLLDARLTGLDPRVVQEINSCTGAVLIGVNTVEPPPDWEEMGVRRELPGTFPPELLRDAVEAGMLGERTAGPGSAVTAPRCSDTGSSDPGCSDPGRSDPGRSDPVPTRRNHRLLGQGARGPTGRLVAVSGSGGVGASTVAMAVAQGLAAGGSEDVVLVDAARRADQAMLHDVGDVMPGLPELVEARRDGAGPLDPQRIRDLAFRIPERGYSLLLGCRSAQSWARTLGAGLADAVDSIRHAFGTVVMDHDPEVEVGGVESAAVLADRHSAALYAVSEAQVMVVVTDAGPKGLHDAVRRIDELCEAGVPLERMLVCANRSEQRSAGPRLRASLGHLSRARCREGGPPAVVVLPRLRRVGLSLHDGLPLPRRFVSPIASAVAELLMADPPVATLGREPEAGGGA